jgi:hypothetical protein
MNALNNKSQTESSVASVRGLQDRSTSASLATNPVSVESYNLTYAQNSALSEVVC